MTVKSFFTKIIIFAVVSAVSGGFTPLYAGEYDHKIEVEGMTFEWKIDGDNINVKLQAQTNAWAGIGFNPSEQMKDADFVLGYVKNGKVKIVDHFGSGHRAHMDDKKMGGAVNLSNEKGREEDGKTEIEFTKPLNSGDKNDGEIKPDGDTTVLLAYGDGRDSFKTRHKFRTVLKVNLSTGKFEVIK